MLYIHGHLPHFSPRSRAPARAASACVSVIHSTEDWKKTRAMARARGGSNGGLLLLAVAVVMSTVVGAQLRQNYYGGSSCPSAESTVRSVISQRLRQSFAVGPGTLRLFFHDCFVRINY
jgi:hypothetical protein